MPMLTRPVPPLLHSSGIRNDSCEPTLRFALWGQQGVGMRSFIAALELSAYGEGLCLHSLDVETENVLLQLRMQRASCSFPVEGSEDGLPQLNLRLCPQRTRLKQSSAVTIVLAPWQSDADVTVPNTWVTDARSDGICASEHQRLQGVICLVDPTQVLTRPWLPGLTERERRTAPPHVVLQSLLAQLRCRSAGSGERLALPVAICLTQMDRPEHHGHLGRENDYFRRLYGNVPLGNWVYHADCKIFGCSAVGVLQRAKHIISNANVDETGQPVILDPTVPPIGVLAPIRWLISRVRNVALGSNRDRV